MEKITLPTELVNAMLQYLGTRPYGEVFKLIAAVQAEAAHQVPQPEADPVE
jgi:hypothetical protein